MKLLYTASDRFEAEMVSGKLTAHEIPNVAQFDDQNGLRPSMSFTSGVKIFVPDEIYEEALIVLNLKDEEI